MEYTERGFAITESFETAYHGEMRVQESSSVVPAIWIFSSKAYSNHPTTDTKPDFHLQYEDAKKLYEELGKMIQHMKSSEE